VYLVFFAGGILSHVLYGGIPAQWAWTAPVFLALASAIVVASAPAWWRPLVVAVIAAGVGFLAAMAGGRAALQPLVWAGLWVVLFAYVCQMQVKPVLSALWMTAIDVVIEPLASNDLAYWQWRDGGTYFGVPVINFAGWFAVSLILFYIPREPAPRSASIQMVGRTMLFFFCAIAAAHHYLFPAFFGVALAAAGYWRFRSIR
jgi:putative membrane protein